MSRTGTNKSDLESNPWPPASSLPSDVGLVDAESKSKSLVASSCFTTEDFLGLFLRTTRHPSPPRIPLSSLFSWGTGLLNDIRLWNLSVSCFLFSWIWFQYPSINSSIEFAKFFQAAFSCLFFSGLENTTCCFRVSKIKCLVFSTLNSWRAREHLSDKMAFTRFRKSCFNLSITSSGDPFSKLWSLIGLADRRTSSKFLFATSDSATKKNNLKN